jgi:transcriptional antiterminator RfaH
MNFSGGITMCRKLWSEVNWFALHAKPRRENFALTNVRLLGIETLLPLLKVERSTRGNSHGASKPLFPGYFFARFCPEISCELVKCTRGVLRVVSSGKFPIPIHDAVIQEIRDRIEEDGLVRLRSQRLEPGTRVSILDGPFGGLMGRVERESDDGRRVAILLETLMCARVEIETRMVEAEAA